MHWRFALNSYEVLGNLTALVVLLAQITLVLLQAAMLRRTGHMSFLLLLVGSALGVIYTVLSFLPLFVQLSESNRLLIFQCSSISVVVAAIIGVSGTVGLFRSYRNLFQAAQHAPQGSA